MTKEKGKTLHIIAIVMFVATIAVNYLSTLGVIFPHTQQEVSDMHQNLLAPAGFTFSIWGVIYLGMLITLILPWITKMSEGLEDLYYNKVMPLYITWMVFNIVWIVTWSYNLILAAMIAIILYTVSLIKLVQTMDKSRVLAFEKPWLLLFPIGLHTGWLTFATFTNVMTLMVKNGFDAFSSTGVFLTILLMALAAIAVLLLFNAFDNAFITVPALWALFGIFMEQRPGSDFPHPNQTVMIAAIVLFVVSLIIHFLILKKHRAVRPR